MKDNFKDFEELFDFHWIGRVFVRFERDYLAGLPDPFLARRYALTPNLLGTLKRYVEIRHDHEGT